MVSRSNWEKTEEIYIIARPIGDEVSNCSLIEIKSIFMLLSCSISFAKSPILRLIRSRR